MDTCCGPAVDADSGQPEHTSLPRADLYVPTSHETHPDAVLLLPSRVNPALQMQSPKLVAPDPVVVVLAGQLVHPLLPAVSLYEPAGHTVHDAPPSGPVYPTTQLHAVTDVDASLTVLLFAGHAVHAADPIELLYPPPTAHAEHSPFRPVYPAMHVHAVAADAPAAVVLALSRHPSHTALPANALYEPNGHKSHGPPSGPDDPALHRHAAGDVDASPSVDDDDGQLLHPADPVKLLYVPVLHPVHAVPSAPVNPILHRHSDRDLLPVLPVSELLGHVTHATDPLADLYVPTAHPVQTPPLDPVYPLLHTHP